MYFHKEGFSGKRMNSEWQHTTVIPRLNSVECGEGGSQIQEQLKLFCEAVSQIQNKSHINKQTKKNKFLWENEYI